jgi:hypothetical protein
MAANDIYTMTPGSAVSDALQQILAERRLDARQALLDSLHQQDVQSIIRDRDQNSRTNEEYRRGLIEQRKSLEAERQATANKTRLGEVMPGPINNPNTLGFLNTNFPDLVKNNPQPTLPPQEFTQGMLPPDAQPENVFLGTPEYQVGQRNDQGLKDLSHNPDFDKMSPIEKFLAIRQYDPKGQIPQQLLMPTKDEQYVPILDWKGNDTGNWAPSNSIRLPEPQQTKQPNTGVTVLGPDMSPDGKPTGKTWVYEHSTGKEKLLDTHVAAKAAGKPVDLYNRSAASAYVRSLRVKGPQGQRESQAAMQILINSITDPEVKADIVTITSDPKMRVAPLDQLVAHGWIEAPKTHIDGTPTTPDEQMMFFQKLRAALAAVRGAPTVLPDDTNQ